MPRRRNSRSARATVRPLQAGDEVWAYLRVSTGKQAEAGLPIDGQREAVETYCQARAYRLTRTYSDEGISGTTDHRAQFQAMVDEAQALRPCGIVLWSWSRFSRDQNDAAFYKALLRRHGVDLLTVDDEVPNVEGFGNILEALIHWRDERENVARGQATKRGHHALAHLGYHPAGNGNCPIGYRAATVVVTIGGREGERRRIELDPALAPMVRRAYEMRLAGGNFEAINEACRLFAHPNDLGAMFRNPTYHGRYHWGETEVAVPAIVTEAEWQRVYDGLAKGKGGSYSRTKASDYLLSGLVWCGVCGARMKGHSCSPRGRRWHYYRCFTPDCIIRGIPRAELEAAVTERLITRYLTPRLVADMDARARQHQQDSGQQERIAALRAEVRLHDKAITNLVSALERAPDTRELTERLRQRTQERTHLLAEIAALEHSVPTVPSVEDVLGLRERLKQALVDGERRLARELIRQCVERVTVEGRGVWRVKWRLLVCPR